MSRNPTADGEGSKRIKGPERAREAASKHIRYTEEQVEVLEKLYAVCPNPSCFQRQQILREQPILSGIDSKQLKIWFQNHRCREKQKKENDELQEENRNLAVANKLLRAENDSLYNKVTQLLCENEYLWSHFLVLTSPSTTTATTNDQFLDAETSAPELSMTVADNKCLLDLADEDAVSMSRDYIRSMISFVKSISMEMEPQEPNPSTNSTEANSIVGSSINQSMFAAMNDSGENLAQGFSSTQEETYAGMEIHMSPDPSHASMHVAPYSAMGLNISPCLNDVSMNFVEANQYMGLSMTQDPMFSVTNSPTTVTTDSTNVVTNFTEVDRAMELLFTPDPTFTATSSNALNLTEAKRANKFTTNLDWTYEEMSSIGGNQDTTYAAMDSDGATPVMGMTVMPGANDAVHLANLMGQSYRSILGVDMFGFNCQDTNSVFELVQHHEYAILCFSFTSVPMGIYGNQAGLRMLETTIDSAVSLSLNKILWDSSVLSLTTVLSTVIQQGYAILSHGLCQTEMNNYIMYEKCVIWKVHGPDGSFHCMALAFINWFSV